jgi:hydrogenase nickel incorporation protein HypA/HybF
MHEFGVMTYLLSAVEDKAQELHATRVLAINLVIGDRASIVDDSLLYYFEMMTPGTVVEGATLNTRRVPSRFFCSACANSYEPVGFDYRCPNCGGIGQMTDEGSEFLIESIVIERP